MRLSLKLRAHEWLADHFRWIQYPDLRKAHYRQRHPQPSLWWRYRRMTWRQTGWFWFAIFWSIVALFAFTNLRD
jgi:hypothetical protein